MWVPYSGKAQVSINIDNMDVGSMHHLYPFDFNSFPKPQDLADDVSVQRVVTILHGNIKQWSFIESQLLEPNVNLGMPEIFIPLRHLTTTLEVLGKILFMKNDLTEAKACLERACPLMELLPSDQNHYATACFNLLREVYNNFYGPDGKGKDKDKEDSNQVIEIDMEVDIALEGSPHNLEDFDFDQNNEDDEYNNSNSGRRRSRFNDSKGKTGENYSNDRYNKLDDPDSAEPFDVESRLEQLRSPYEHLRAELQEKVQNAKPIQKLLGEPTTIQPSSSTTKRGKIENNIKTGIPNQFQQPRRKPLKLTDPDEIIFPAYMYESSYDGRLLRLKTKFDNVLRRFVLEGTKDSRQVVMKQAEDLLEEFYISIEDASVEAGHDLREFNEIMDLGNAFLEMLSKATIDFEFSFIIDDIKAIGLDTEYMLNGEETIEHTNHLAPFDRSRVIVLKAVGRALHYMILPHETSNFDQYSNGLHTPSYGHDSEASAALFDQTTSSIPSGHRSAVPTLKGDMKIATNIMLFSIFCIVCLIAGNQYNAPPRKGKVRSRSKNHNKTFLDTVQALFLKQATRDSDDEDSVQSKTARKNSSFKGGDKLGSNQYVSKSLIDHVVGLAKIFMSSIRGTVVNGKSSSSSKRKESSKVTKPKKVKSEKADKSSNNSKNGSNKIEESKSTSETIDSIKSNSSDDSYDEGQDSDEINMSNDDSEASNDDFDSNVSQVAPIVVKPELESKSESVTEVVKVVTIPLVKKVEFSVDSKQSQSIVAPTSNTLKPALKQTQKNSSSPAIKATTSKKNSTVHVQEKIQPVVQSAPVVVTKEVPAIKEIEKNPPKNAPVVVEVKVEPIIQPVAIETPILGLNVENDAVLNTEYDVFSKHSKFSILQPSTNSNLPIANEEDEEDNLLFLSTQLSTGGMTNSGLGGLWGLFAPAPAAKIPVDNGSLNGFDRGLQNSSSIGVGLDIPVSSSSSYMSSFDQNYQPFISPQMNAYSNDPLRMDYNGLSNNGLNSNEQPPLSNLSFDLVTDLSANAPSFSPFTGNFDPLLQNHAPLLNGLNSNSDNNTIASGYFAPPPGLSDFNGPVERASRLFSSNSQDEKDTF